MSTLAHAPKPAPTIHVRHPGSHASGDPLAFGPYATGGMIHAVDPATAARLLARGFEIVSDAEADAATDATPPANPAITLFPADPAAED